MSRGLGTPGFSVRQASLRPDAADQAYRLFHLALSAEDEHDPPFDRADQQSRVVFKNGSVGDEWLPIAQEDGGGSPTLFHHDQYADRISFDFTFGSYMTYDIRAPTCSSPDANVAKPKVVDFQVQPEEQSGSFSIVYDCYRHPKTEALRNTTVSVVLPVIPGLSIFYSFRKTCGGGKHKHIEFGYFEESQNEVAEVRRNLFGDGSDPVSFGPHVMSTKLYVRLMPPAISQEFFHVRANSSKDVLTLAVRGPSFGGVIKSPDMALIHILYNCHGSGIVDVSVRIPIFPFHELNGTWKKDCGGGLAEGLNVGSSPLHRNDIVKNAVTSDAWKIMTQRNASNNIDRAPEVNNSVRMKDFLLFNDGVTVHVAPALITVSDPAVLVVLSYSPTARKEPEDRALRNLLQNGAMYRLRLHMICKKKGASAVVVTFPVKSFSNVDFGFVKHCRAPKRYEHSGFLRTASSVTWTASLVMAVAFALWWFPYYQTLVTQDPYKPLSSSGRPSSTIHVRKVKK